MTADAEVTAAERDAQVEALRKIVDKWGVPDDSFVGKLPRVVCRKCSQNRQGGTCDEHPRRVKCDICNAFVSPRHIHIDFMGHASVTLALIDADPLWSWEPVAWTDEGEPRMHVKDGRIVMWARLTVHGKTLSGVGTCETGKAEPEKEVIGDFLRNAAMRFGVGLGLWAKEEWDLSLLQDDDTAPGPAAAPEPPPASPPAADQAKLGEHGTALSLRCDTEAKQNTAIRLAHDITGEAWTFDDIVHDEAMAEKVLIQARTGAAA